MAMSEDDRRQIASVVEQYRSGFGAMDPDLLKRIWDQSYDNLCYIASERREPITTWRGISEYYEQLPVGLASGSTVTMRVGEVSADVFGDAAYAFCTFHYEGGVEGRSEPFIADGRVTFILRRRNGAWKVIHYHESTAGPVEAPAR